MSLELDAELNSEQTVSGYLPKDDGLKHALTGADMVVIPAGIPRQCCLKATDID